MTGRARTPTLLRPWLACVLLVVGCFYIYQQVPGTNFVMFDDDVNFVYNEHLGPLNWERLRWAFTEHEVMVRYVPVSWLFCCALTGINGLDPFWFHSSAILLHGGSCVLLYLLLKRLCGRFGHQAITEGPPKLASLLPFALAAWWGWHPLRVEAVAWATPLLYVLATSLGLLGLMTFCHSLEKEELNMPHRLSRVGAWVLCAAALLAHPSAIGIIPLYAVLPILILVPSGGLKCWWKDKDWQWMSIKRVFPFILAGVAALAITMAVRQMGSLVPRDGTPSLADFSVLQRCAQGSAVLVHFLEKSLWPGKLNPVYPLLYQVNPWAPFFLVSILASIGLMTLLLFTFWRSIKIGLLAIVTILACVPVLGLQEHPYFPCDRYTYIPALSLVILILAVTGLRSISRNRSLSILMIWLMAMIPIWLVMANRQTRIWSTTEGLYEEIAEIQTSAAVRSHFLCRGVAEYLDSGEIEAARAALVRLQAEIPPDANTRSVSAYLAQSLQSGKPATYAVLLNAQAHRALNNGENRLAMDRLQRALAMQPDYGEARFNMSLLLALEGQPREALAHYFWIKREGAKFPSEQREVLRRTLALAFRNHGDENAAKALESDI